MGKKRNAYMILVGKPEGKTHRWVDNVKMYHRDRMGWYGLGSCGFADLDIPLYLLL
jgi:hypothetical protein